MPTPVGLIPTSFHPRTIAVDLDDTLNNFGETLRTGEFPHDPMYALPKETYEQYLQLIREGANDPGIFMSSGFNFCRYKIHLQCWQQSRARPDGVAFMQWLRQNGWRIVICTRRDMRLAYDSTIAWLRENDIPHDHLFMAANKIAFCWAWGIQHLVDDEAFNIAHGYDYNINVYYPILPQHESLPPHRARGFHSFTEVQQWITE